MYRVGMAKLKVSPERKKQLACNEPQLSYAEKVCGLSSVARYFKLVHANFALSINIVLPILN